MKRKKMNIKIKYCERLSGENDVFFLLENVVWTMKFGFIKKKKRNKLKTKKEHNLFWTNKILLRTN